MLAAKSCDHVSRFTCHAQGGFSGTLADGDNFGCSVASIGDVDEDGVDDLAVGACQDADGGTKRGAVWVLFMTAAGTVKQQQKISSLQGKFSGPIPDNGQFGCGLAALGDLDGNGVPDLAVGVPSDADGGLNRGAVWVLFLNSLGKVISEQKISSLAGDFSGTLGNGMFFGNSLASLGDMDDDGVSELAVGHWKDDGSGTRQGALWVLFLNSNGTVKAEQKIGDANGGFKGTLADDDFFGSSVVSLGDLDDDGMPEVVVGASGNDGGGSTRGAVWVLHLDKDGIVKTHLKISDSVGGFSGSLSNGDQFGHAVGSRSGLDLIVGVPVRNGGPGYAATGSMYIITLSTPEPAFEIVSGDCNYASGGKCPVVDCSGR